MIQKKNLRSVFFGTSKLSVIVLDELKKAGIVPSLIVTAPDRPQGRGLIMTPPPVKEWAEENSIDYIQPDKLKDEDTLELLTNTEWDVFFLASYGKIIPKIILDAPKHGIMNVHPSLLPKFRGASPFVTAILEDEQETGVTIMLLDEEMDHGPIIAQAQVTPEVWPMKALDLEELLAHVGGELLAESTLPWVNGEITSEEQEHDKATYTAKIEKADGELNLDANGYQNYLKYCAFDVWPGVFFFAERNGKQIRVKVKEASYQKENNAFIIERVIPEGKKEMSYEDFLRG